MIGKDVCTLLLCTFLCTVYALKEEAINSNLQNVNVDRKVDLTTHVVKINVDITITNGGNSGTRLYLYALPSRSNLKVSFIGAKQKDTAATLKVTAVKVPAHPDVAFYGIELPTILGAGKSVKITVETVYPHILRPFPVEILQSEKQFVVYEDLLYIYSPYATTKLTTVIQAATSTIESYTKTKPTSVRDNTITYGPYSNIAPFSEGSVRVHYENNSPFLTVTELVRVVELSHWGNIAIEEHVDIRHTGAKLKGPFSRYHYQRMQDGVSSVRSFKTILPAAARDVYYRDEIGNISTSNMREMDDAVEVELRPRFPLMGGWKTSYCLGYNVPSYEYLYNRGDDYLLKMRFVDHIIDDQVIDKVTVKVILPEGASNLKVKTPFDIKREKDEMHYTYLDTIGRPVVVLSKENLVEQHISNFEVHYTFQKWMLLQEPLLVVAAFYLLCLLVIVYVRLDFSITKDEAKESRMRVASLMDEVHGVQDRRSALHQSYDDAMKKLKTSKDGGAFKANVKKIDADYRGLTNQIDAFVAQLKVQNVDAAEKVTELQRLESQYKDQIVLALQYTEKVVSGKMNRAMYDENDGATATKRSDLAAKIDAVLDSL